MEHFVALQLQVVVYTQCGNFMIFLSPKSYVKSILGILEVQNVAQIEVLDSPELISRKIWVIEKSENFHTV